MCELTLEYIKSNDEIVFSWDIQNQWINEILNDFYEEYALVLVTMQCDNTDEEEGHLADTFIEMVVPDANLYDLG